MQQRTTRWCTTKIIYILRENIFNRVKKGVVAAPVLCLPPIGRHKLASKSCATTSQNPVLHTGSVYVNRSAVASGLVIRMQLLLVCGSQSAIHIVHLQLFVRFSRPLIVQMQLIMRF